MEAVEAFLDGEWESLTKLFSCEGSDVQLHFNGGNFFSGDTPSCFFAGGDDNVAGADYLNPNFYCASQESSNCSEIEPSPVTSFHGENHQPAAVNGGNYFLQDLVSDNNTFQSMDYCGMDSSMVPVFSDDLMEEILQLKAQMCSAVENGESFEEMQLKRKYEAPPRNAPQSEEDNASDPSPKKRPRVSRDAQRNKRNAQSRKNKKAISNDEEANNGVGNGQSWSNCSVEEANSNGNSQEMNGGSTSESKGSASTGKAKASKGPATDPQSLYARKRRERINERLRILQNLVPNGTKVDISTMLEEAVHYVKFLQLQIKLLSSDDMWMYAPIAYNGMDMGLYQKIVPNLWPQN